MTFRETAEHVLGHCLDSFGETIIYTPQGQPAVEVLGIFDSLYESVDPDTGAVVTSQQPVLGVRDADVGFTPRQDDQVEVRGVTYRIKEVQTDGQGGSRLFLHRSA